MNPGRDFLSLESVAVTGIWIVLVLLTSHRLLVLSPGACCCGWHMVLT